MGQAREHLSRALGVLQESGDEGERTQALMATMAETLGTLFEGENATSSDLAAEKAKSVAERLGALLSEDEGAEELAPAKADLEQARSCLEVQGADLEDQPTTRRVAGKATLVMGSTPGSNPPEGGTPMEQAVTALSQHPPAPEEDEAPLPEDATEVSKQPPVEMSSTPEAQTAAPADATSADAAEPATEQQAEPAAEAKAEPATEAAAPSPQTQEAAQTVNLAEPTGKEERLEVNIGATTQSNFYVGFSSDLAEGGVFVATYAIKKAGTRLQLFVTLPGGYEFEALGEVRFVRDPLDLGSSAEPGMGVRFLNIKEEQLGLARRFSQKRAPFFYDD